MHHGNHASWFEAQRLRRALLAALDDIADICLRLSVIASDGEVASQLIAMAQAYRAKAAALERRPAGSSHGISGNTQSNAEFAVAQTANRCKDVGPPS
jgi:hypothetical protein